MSDPHVDQPGGAPEGGFTVNDKRRIDPETGAVRNFGSAPAGSADADSFAAEAAAGAEVESDVTAAEAALSELTADLQRVHAEYANYRKRVERDRELMREHGELDGGFRSVGEALEATVTRLGLTTFGAVGDEFDPTRHEALTHSADEAGDGPTVTVVTAIYQPGYAFAERVIRPARVGVADQPA